MTDEFYSDLKKLIPERWWGKVIWGALIVWGAFALWYIPHLSSRIDDYEQVDLIAKRLSPDKEPDERIQALVDQVGEYLDEEDKEQRASYAALLQNCHIEIIRNEWAMEHLAKTTTDSTSFQQPSTTACEDLATHPKAPFVVRASLQNLVSEMRSASTFISTGWDTCRTVRKLTEIEVGATREKATEWGSKLAEAKKKVTELLAKERLPIVEERMIDGVRAMNVCEPKVTLPDVASGP